MQESAGITKSRGDGLSGDYHCAWSGNLACDGGDGAWSARRAIPRTDCETRNGGADHVSDGFHRLSARRPLARPELGISACFTAARRLQNQCCYSFAGDKSAAILQRLRIVAGWRKQSRGLIPFIHGARERIPREDNSQVRLTVAEQRSRLDQRSLAREGFASDRDIGPSQSVPQSHMTGRSIGKPFRKGTGVRATPTICGSALEKSFCEFSTSEAGAEHYCDPGPVQLDAPFGQR